MVVKVIIQSCTNKNIEFANIALLSTLVASSGTYDFTLDLPVTPVYLIYASTDSNLFQWKFGFNSSESAAGYSDITTLTYLERPVKISWINVYNANSSAANLSIVVGWD